MRRRADPDRDPGRELLVYYERERAGSRRPGLRIALPLILMAFALAAISATGQCGAIAKQVAEIWARDQDAPAPRSHPAHVDMPTVVVQLASSVYRRSYASAQFTVELAEPAAHSERKLMRTVFPDLVQARLRRHTRGELAHGAIVSEIAAKLARDLDHRLPHTEVRAVLIRQLLTRKD